MSENAQRQMTPEERHWATRIRAAVVPTVGDGDQEDVPSLAVAIAARIATLERQVEQAREALEKIEAKAPSQYEPDAEYWEWGNYDDSYAYGLDTATMRCAQIATAALQALREGGGSC